MLPNWLPSHVVRQPGKHVENMPFLVYILLFAYRRDSYMTGRIFP